MFKMPKTPLLLLCLVVGPAEALYKQWIPDTNYENKTNWDSGVVPCGNDRVVFPAQRKVSVFVETTHAVQELRLPLDGEFILDSDAGFYVVAGRDPDCGAGVTTNFRDSEALQWFDPTLWRTAVSQDDLQRGKFVFSVHEESVPCHYDDVVFEARSSFRVDTSSDQPSVPVKSVSVLGKAFGGSSEFKQYLGSRSGRLQFHGSSEVTAGSPGCQDASGCDCGNSAHRQRICSNVACGPLSCLRPLQPSGHCCSVCGAIVTIAYAEGFSLQAYRQRIQHLFLILPQYKSAQLGMSKVFKTKRLMGVVPFGTAAEIQLVVLDEMKASEALAQDIVKDALSHGSNLGITGAEFQASSGGSSGQSGSGAGVAVGVVFGILVVVALVAAMVFLVRRGFVRLPPMPSMPSLSSLRSRGNAGDLGGAADLAFDNPMFDKPNMLPDIPGLHGSDSGHSISLSPTGVHFVNPVYDENETDFTA